MAELSRLRADPRAARDGVWIDCGYIVDGLEIKTRSKAARFYDLTRQYEASAKREAKNKQPNGELKAEVQIVANMRALIDSCLVDVRGLTDNKEPVSFDTFKDALISADYPDLNAAAYYAAQQATELKAETKEEAQGNLLPS